MVNKSKLVSTRILGCFGCGLVGFSRNGSVVAGATRSNEVPTIAPSSAPCNTGPDSASGALESPPGSRPSTAGLRPRRPSTAFTEPAAQGLLTGEANPAKKLSNASAAAGVPAAAAAALPPPTAADARKPRVRTSRVSPAYDTEDELSPAGLSRSPSNSVDGSSSPAYTSSFPSPEGEPPPRADTDTDAAGSAMLRGPGVPVTDDGSGETSYQAKVRRGAGSGGSSGAVVAEFGRGSGAGLRPSEPEVAARQRSSKHSGRDEQVPEVDGGMQEAPHVPGAVGVASEPLTPETSASLASSSSSLAAATAAAVAAAGMAAAVAGGCGSNVHSRAASAASTAAAAAAVAPTVGAVRRSSVGSTAATSSRNTSIATRASASGSTSTSRSVSAAERPGSVGGGSAPAAAAAGLSLEPDSPRPAFVRCVGSCSFADAATTAVVVPCVSVNADADADDACSDVGDDGGDFAAGRRTSFAGDSSTSLVGPATVATTPQLRSCPSLRPTDGSVTTLQAQEPPPPSPRMLVPCESLRLSPPPPPPPTTLPTCGSLRLSPLSPLSPPRCLTPSMSLRPTPMLPHSPSLACRPPLEDRLLLLPGSQAPEPEASPAGSPSDQMLRLPPTQQQPLFQHSPCSFSRSAFPRANTLAPLLTPTSNTAALNRLVSLQAAFRERQQQGQGQQVQAASEPQDGVDCSGEAKAEELRGRAEEPSASTAAAASSSRPLESSETQPRDPDRELFREASFKQQLGSAPAAAATATVAALAAAAASIGGEGGDGDQYDSDAEYDDDVTSMVSHLLPPSTFRSSAPAVPFGGALCMKGHVRRTGSLDHPRPAEDPQCTAPLSDFGEPVPAAVSEAAELEQASLETHAAKWLEQLLPPSPGYLSPNGTTGRPGLGLAPSVAAGVTGRKPVPGPAADSFKNLMQEIE